MKKTYAVYRIIENSNGTVNLTKMAEFNKKYNSEKYIKELGGQYLILTKYLKIN